MEKLTIDSFKTKIFDYESKKDWEYVGELPSIIDFYADWCGPCKMVTPILEELANEYSGKLNIYKINTDEQNELAAMFGISSIPSLLFIPLKEQPQMAVGALTKAGFHSIIKNVLHLE